MELRLLKPEWLSSDNKLTAKAADLLEEMELLLTKRDKKIKKDVMGEDHRANIEAYRNLFPAIKLPSGKHARSSIPELEKKFTLFFNLFPHITWEQVLEATRKYVEDYGSRNYMYMKRAAYYIAKQKEDKSWEYELAEHCENPEEDIPTHYSINIK